MNNMICGNCKIDRLASDFIKNQKYCYRCEYQKKKTKNLKNRTVIRRYCRICNKEIIQKQTSKYSRRTVFCSWECAEKGHKDLMHNYWTNKVRFMKVPS